MKHAILLVSIWIVLGLSIIIGGSSGVVFGNESCEGFEGPVDISGEYTGNSKTVSLDDCDGSNEVEFGSALTLKLVSVTTEGETAVLTYNGTFVLNAGFSQWFSTPSEGHEYGCWYMTLLDLEYTIEGDISWKFDTSTNSYRLDDDYFTAEVIPGTVPCGASAVGESYYFQLGEGCCTETDSGWEVSEDGDTPCVYVFSETPSGGTGTNFDGCTEFEYIQPGHTGRSYWGVYNMEGTVLDATVLDTDVAPTGTIKGHLFSAVQVETPYGYEYADMDQATVDLYRQDAAVREKNDDETIEEYLDFLEEQGRTLINSIEIAPGDDGNFSFEEVTVYDSVNGSETAHYLYTIAVTDARVEGIEPDNPSLTKMLYYAPNARVNLIPETEEPFTVHDIPLAPLESFVVNSTGDDGDADLSDEVCDTDNEITAGKPECTLRAAIEQANYNEGSNVITYNIPGPGPYTIYPRSALPTITDPVTIAGTTQPSDIVTTGLEPTQNDTPTNMIVVDGSILKRAWGAFFETKHGFHTAAQCTIEGHIIINFKYGAGIFLAKGSDGSRIKGNVIGIDKDGKKQGNGDGVIINSPYNWIGPFRGSPSNVISGNRRTGITIFGKDAKGNRVLGNLIGTDKDGEKKLGNISNGVVIKNAPENVIGGEQEGAGNIISDNWGHGIYIQGKDAKGNKVLGNLIGTDKDGEEKLGNKEDGVHIENAPENEIGGGGSSSKNYISGNSGDGVMISGRLAQKNKVQGNAIGIFPSNKVAENGGSGVRISFRASNNIIGKEGLVTVNWIVTKNKSGVVLGRLAGKGNAILSNSIRIVEIQSDKARQKAIGIDLGNDGPTSNSLFSSGPNNRQHYPVLDSAKLKWDDKLVLKGSLNSRGGKTHTIQFFSGKCDPEKGELSYSFLDSTSVLTDEQGNGEFEYESESDVEVGDFISATATDPDGNTSEFSSCVPVEEE